MNSGGNKIKFIHVQVFQSLNNLQEVRLAGNECIDEDFDGSDEVATLTEEIKIKCTDPSARSPPRSSHDTPTSNLFNFECGKVAFPGGFVKGGNETKRGQWPFLVALHHLESKRFFCAGSLITSQHVLTGEKFY